MYFCLSSSRYRHTLASFFSVSSPLLLRLLLDSRHSLIVKKKGWEQVWTFSKKMELRARLTKCKSSEDVFFETNIQARQHGVQCLVFFPFCVFLLFCFLCFFFSSNVMKTANSSTIIRLGSSDKRRHCCCRCRQQRQRRQQQRTHTNTHAQVTIHPGRRCSSPVPGPE